LTGNISIPNFITFSQGVASPITFDLTQILPGTGTAANCTNGSGNPCTPAGSPFTLTQSSTGVTVNLAFLGNAYTGTAASGTTPVSSLFTTQIVMPCNTDASCLALLGAGGTIDASYSASFVASAIPEPSSLFLIGAGLVGMGSLARRKLEKRS
jgi:hypothetical protein